MRHTLFLILIWMPLLICATDKNVNITIKLSTELSQTEQWIYASGYVGANEYAILDSVKVNKGDTQTKLSFDIYEGPQHKRQNSQITYFCAVMEHLLLFG